jgi:3-phenylpropionate/trans-cinnamate dioxygenase ferredoxin subunit
MKKVVLQGKEIIVSNIDGYFYAIDSVCTHFGGDLSQGIMEGSVITCPRHQAKFDVTTGRVLSPPKVGPYNPKIQDLGSYAVQVKDNEITIKL